jgi:XTP/dITP diphosphohydrolase
VVLLETRGEFEGVISDEPRGVHGFGYDPHLWIPELAMTSAELPPEKKNELSHRGRAVRRMAYLLTHKRISW